MEKSLFPAWVDKYFKMFTQKIVEKLNGSTNPLTYLHRTMLKKEYSPTLRWGSLSTSNTVVSADVVAMDSSLPLKKRDSIKKADGEIPKIGMKLALNETTMNELNILLAVGGQDSEVLRKLFADTNKVVSGVWERLEFMFHQALSTGYILVADDDNPGLGVRVNFNHSDDNKFGVEIKWSESGAKCIDDIDRVIEAARPSGNTIKYILMDKATWNKFKQNQQVREGYAFYRDFVGSNIPPVQSVEKANEFLQASYGVTITIVDRHVLVEKNGTQKSIKPWADNAVVFLTDLNVGTLTYGRLAEETFPSKNVDYQKLDDFILVSKYHLNDPIKELTSSQAIVLPVLNNIDSIYIMDCEESQTESGQTEDDATITIYADSTVTIANLVNALNEVGVTASSEMTDVQLIKLVNKLSKAKEATLKEILEIPVVDAGANTTSSAATKALLGTATAAGDKEIESVLWTQVSGPNTAAFSAATALSTNATGLVTGVYVFKLTATDSEGTVASDTITITATVA